MVLLVRERMELRTRLTHYDEKELLALDLAALHQKWQLAQKTCLLPKWLHPVKIRKNLRAARPD